MRLLVTMLPMPFQGAEAPSQPREQSATYVPKWKATTAYAVGDIVSSPSGDIVVSKAAFTSGVTFTAADWSAIPAITDLVINVKHSGSKGDGIADDRPACQAAIDYLRNGGRTGGVARFPIGEYKMGNTLKLPTGVTIRGAQGGF